MNKKITFFKFSKVIIIASLFYLQNTFAQAPVANFTVDTDTIEQYEVVTFTDLSTNTPYQWQWIIYDSVTYINDPSLGPVADLFNGAILSDPFANGRDEFSKNPQFEFDMPGKYTVVLKATNANGTGTMRKVKYIIVTKPTKYILGFGTYGYNSDNNVSSATGSVFDNGGPNLNYGNNQGKNTRSFLKIKPCSAKEISLKFTQLKFADSNNIY